MEPKDITKRELAVGIIFRDEEGEIWDEDANSFDGKTELEPIVDRDLDAFGKFYMEEMGNGSFHGVERAAIKTYIAWKLSVVRKG